MRGSILTNKNQQLTTNEYPSSYEELASMATYLKGEATLLDRFVSEEVDALTELLRLMSSRDRKIHQVQEVIITPHSWISRFANLNSVFLMKDLELLYGVGCPGVPPSVHALSIASFQADYISRWKDRVTFTLSVATNNEDEVKDFRYSKRCWSWFEHLDHNREKVADIKRLVSCFY